VASAVDLDRMRVDELGAAIYDRDAGGIQQPPVDAVQTHDLAILVTDQRRHIEIGCGATPAVAGGAGEIVRIMRGVAE
jgi:hypothetical protein